MAPKHQLLVRTLDLGIINSFLVTRKLGEEVQQVIVQTLKELPAQSILNLNLSGIDIMDYSFADEAIAKTLGRLVMGEFGKCYLIITGTNESLEENIDIALKQRQLAILCQNDTTWSCLGAIKEHLLQTLTIVNERKEATARDLANIFRLAINTASNRLIELAKMHLVHREETPINGGGKQYVYKSLI